MQKLFIVFILLCLSACAGTPFYPSAIDTRTAVSAGSGVGFAAGVAAEKTKDKIAESLTPVFPLHKMPIVVCSLESLKAYCIVVPCALKESDPDYTKECSLIFNSLDEFIAFSPKVVPLEVTARQVAAIINKCEKDEDTKAACVEHAGHYEGETFLLTKQ